MTGMMEKRTDPRNGVSYMCKEFVDYYGCTREWDLAIDSSIEYTAPTNIGIAINHYFGGFGISQWAQEQYMDRAREDGYIPTPIRTDERLIKMILTHGSKKVSGPLSSLCVEFIPYDYYVNNCYTIEEYDGGETLILEHETYKIKKMTQIIYNTNLMDSEKIAQMKEIIN